MAYNCYTHGWSSHYQMCPACQKTYTTSSTEITFKETEVVAREWWVEKKRASVNWLMAWDHKPSIDDFKYFNDAIHVIEHSAYTRLLDEARKLEGALDEIDMLKLTCEKLIADKPNRNWIVENDFEKWVSVKVIRDAITNWRDFKKKEGIE